jgi:uncharacterized DUF497 family protein
MFDAEIGSGEGSAPEFEFDPEKSARTKSDPNRGLDFFEMQALWDDPDRVEIPLPFSKEPRMAVIGRIGSKVWTVITTLRGARIRIISARRSRENEKKIYEANN